MVMVIFVFFRDSYRISEIICLGVESTTGYTFTPCVGHFSTPGIDTR